MHLPHVCFPGTEPALRVSAYAPNLGCPGAAKSQVLQLSSVELGWVHACSKGLFAKRAVAGARAFLA
jgi:hypothetical protein